LISISYLLLLCLVVGRLVHSAHVAGLGSNRSRNDAQGVAQTGTYFPPEMQQAKESGMIWNIEEWTRPQPAIPTFPR
jgi:hypothetical protein